VDDGTLLSLLAVKPTLPILYFSREGYERAIRDLPPREIERAIEFRRDSLPFRLPEDSIAFLFLGQMQRLATTAKLASDASPRDRERLDAAFERSLSAANLLLGAKRFEGVAPGDLLVSALEGEARLRAETLYLGEQLERLGKTQEADELARRAGRHERQARALAQALGPLGRPDFGEMLPYVDLQRVWFIAPRDAALEQGIESLHEPYTVWEDGIVMPWKVRNIPQLEERGKTAFPLYFTLGEFVGDLERLTQAQRERELGERLRDARGGGIRATRAHLDGLLLSQILLKRQAAQDLRAAQSAAASLLATQAREDADALRQSLARHDAWLREAPSAESVERATAEDAALFAELARRAPDPLLLQRFNAVLELEPSRAGPA
jgi:hypothetical protein